MKLITLLIAVKEHLPDTELLIVSSTLSPDLQDWINMTRNEHRFDVLTWKERDLE
ncbi:MAG TPA: hypothetical protein VKB96_01955 [Gammaproteobacteria bacterium]|nr:hypothetical protein [Gammaproteobacteria bacterium]